MSIKTGIGNTPVEKQAIDAHAKRLGLEVDPHTRAVDPSSADKVEGGMDALTEAAKKSGEPDTLDLKGLKGLDKTTGVFGAAKEAIARKLGKDAETVAKAKLAGAVTSFEAAGHSLSKLLDNMSETGNFHPLDNTARRIGKAASDLQAAMAPESLAFAGPVELRALKNAYANFLGKLNSNYSALEQIVNKIFLPTADKIVQEHNASTFGRVFSGATAQHVADVAYRVRVMNEALNELLGGFKLRCA